MRGRVRVIAALLVLGGFAALAVAALDPPALGGRGGDAAVIRVALVAAAFLAFGIAAALLAIPAFHRRTVRDIRRRDARCESCGHTLVGSPLCPECGHRSDLPAAAFRAPRGP